MTTSQPPSEETLPPRFTDAFLAKSAGALGVLLIVGLIVLWAVYDKAGLFKSATSAGRHTVGFVFFVLSLLSLALGAFFALVEARKAVATHRQMTVTVTPEAGEGMARGVIDDLPVDMVTKVVDAFAGRKASVVLFATAVSFALVAAASSGNLSISVGTDSGSAPATPTPSVTPT